MCSVETLQFVLRSGLWTEVFQGSVCWCWAVRWDEYPKHVCCVLLCVQEQGCDAV